MQATAQQLETRVELKRKEEKSRLAEQKYSKVRFFERKKLERQLKKATGDDVARIMDDVRSRTLARASKG